MRCAPIGRSSIDLLAAVLLGCGGGGSTPSRTPILGRNSFRRCRWKWRGGWSGGHGVVIPYRTEGVLDSGRGWMQYLHFKVPVERIESQSSPFTH